MNAPPSTQMIIQERTSARSPWSEVIRTEHVWNNRNPQYSTIVNFDFPSTSAEKMVQSTELRIVVDNLAAAETGSDDPDRELATEDVPLSHGNISRADAEARLTSNGRPGDYLIRDRAKTVGPGEARDSWAYSFYGMNEKCSHLRIDVALNGVVAFNGAPEQAVMPGSNLVQIVAHLNASRRAKGLAVGENIPKPASMTNSLQDAPESTLFGWVECALGDIADERDLVIDIEPAETIDDSEPLSPTARTSSTKAGILGLPPKLKLSRRMNFKFNVPTTATGGMKLLLVEQLMGESPFFLGVPAQMLHLFVAADKTSMALYQGLQGLQGKLAEAKNRVQDAIMHRVQTNLDHIAYIDGYKGHAFKASVDKKSKQMEMLCMNLHCEQLKVLAGKARKAGQRTIVTGDSSEASYYTFTHGAFVAHAEGFKHGGLLKILQAPLNRASFEPLRRIRNARQNLIVFEDEVRDMDAQIGWSITYHKSKWRNIWIREEVVLLPGPSTFGCGGPSQNAS